MSQQRVFQLNVNVDNCDWRFYQSTTNVYINDETIEQKNQYFIEKSQKNQQNLNDEYYNEETWNQIDD